MRRPTPKEIEECERLQLTSPNEWNPNQMDNVITSVNNHVYYTSHDPIHDIMQCKYMHHDINNMQFLHEHGNEFSSIYATSFKSKTSISPEKLSKMWHIGLCTAERTLKATTYKCTRTTGLLAKRYKTDKAQLRYNQLSRHNGTFYVDYLKCAVKSIRGFIGGTIYTNKLGFKKFFPHEDERGTSTALGLRQFIDMVGLPASLHTDGHNNFVEGEYKRLIRKFGIPHTMTEPHSPWQNRAGMQ